MYPIDISEEFKQKLLSDPKKRVYIEKSLGENSIPWDINTISDEIVRTIPKEIYSWYLEKTSSSGDSTFAAIEALQKIRIKPNYLNPDKSVSLKRELKLHSDELGTTVFKVGCPFFTAPYGCASVYGGKSDDVNTLVGTVKAGGIYTIPHLSKYRLEYLAKKVKKLEKNAFFMYQIYLTNDNDINISMIERAKKSGVSVIMVTMDIGNNNHGGLGLLDNHSDISFQKYLVYCLLYDPVFNIKCYQQTKCVGTKNQKLLKKIASFLKIPIEKLDYDYQTSLDFAFSVWKGVNLNAESGPFSIQNIARICHSNVSLSDVKIKTRSVPLVGKGCLTPEDALLVQKAGADGIYVSNHGGRFVYNSIAPIDVLEDIRNAVKKVNSDFGVWYDGGIRNGQDILTAYIKGAEFVGIGRPIIYACVMYGEEGAYSITTKMKYELESQCLLCGKNNLDL